MDEPKDVPNMVRDLVDKGLSPTGRLQLHPYQKAVVDHLKNMPPIVTLELSPSEFRQRYFGPEVAKLEIDSCPSALGLDDLRTLARLNRMAQEQRPPLILRPRIAVDPAVDEVVFLHHGIPDAAERDVQTLVQLKSRTPMSGKMAFMLGTLGFTINPLEQFADWDPRGERRLSPDEAREAFKTTDADKLRIDKAEAKRQRRAAKLRSLK